MNAQTTGLRVAGVVFGILCLLQLARLIIRPEVLVEGHIVPLWPSALAVLVLGGLSIWLLRLGGLPTAPRPR